jgi:hypothetical protein
VARHLVRLANALKLFSHHTYGLLAEKMDEVGRLRGGCETCRRAAARVTFCSSATAVK